MAHVSLATAANTSCGGVARATSVATRRSAACSPAIRRASSAALLSRASDTDNSLTATVPGGHPG